MRQVLGNGLGSSKVLRDRENWVWAIRSGFGDEAASASWRGDSSLTKGVRPVVYARGQKAEHGSEGRPDRPDLAQHLRRRRESARARRRNSTGDLRGRSVSPVHPNGTRCGLCVLRRGDRPRPRWTRPCGTKGTLLARVEKSHLSPCSRRQRHWSRPRMQCVARSRRRLPASCPNSDCRRNATRRPG